MKVTLRGLVYVNEAKADFVDSVFGKVQFHAVASLFQANSGWLALIGWRDAKASPNIRVRLFVLDTNTDRLRELGPAPAPPPLEPEFRRTPEDIDMMGSWEAPERHYLELESFVWSFPEANTLKVSYGNDTIKRRAKKRYEKLWNLSKVLASSK